jgi:hypothetical protein
MWYEDKVVRFDDLNGITYYMVLCQKHLHQERALNTPKLEFHPNSLLKNS